MKSKATRICAIVFAAFLAIGALFYLIAGDSLHFTVDSTETVTAKAPLGEITQNESLRQSFLCEFDTLEALTVTVGTMARANTDTILAEILDDKENVIYTTELNTAQMKDNSEYSIVIDPSIPNAKDRYFGLRLTSLHGTTRNSVTFYYGNSVDAGRVDIPVEIQDTEALYFNGERMLDEDGRPCTLCLRVSGIKHHWFGEFYWLILAFVAILLGLFLLRVLHCHKKGKPNAALSLVGSLYKYNFLIRQLVSRDFKTKYKRSVLGMLWSFLNPLLTMSIQYVVFSTIFKSTIPNFIIYLLCGIICFNFFNEATGMCLSSIVSNATLINKVYVPKYIYPFSRTLSSGINLLLSLIPLLLMMLITKTPLRPAALLLPFALLMLFMLSYGVGLILATMMVFFRDTQFLWGIFSMLLMYLTPIFYPDSIIPDRFMPFYKLNPLYHVIRFVRMILMDGVSPEPKAYLLCFLICFIPFVIGSLIFRKNQDKFILNI